MCRPPRVDVLEVCCCGAVGAPFVEENLCGPVGLGAGHKAGCNKDRLVPLSGCVLVVDDEGDFLGLENAFWPVERALPPD